MSMEHPEIDVTGEVPWKDDPRYQLLQRILESPDFVRSPQLARFLLYICSATFEGRTHILSEQHIGVEIFGREPGYDSASDTIVRSHALRLRRRLEQFFQRAGRHEPLQLIVPRGAYVPVFLAAAQSAWADRQPTPSSVGQYPDRNSDQNPDRYMVSVRSSSSAEPALSIEPAPPVESMLVESPLAKSSLRPSHAADAGNPGASSNWTISKARDAALWRYRLATILLSVVCLGLIVALGLHIRTHFPMKRHHPLWGRLFTDDQPTHIVLGDSGLVLFHAFARQRVSLHDYLNDDVSKQMPYVQHVDPWYAQFLLHRRYTSMVDAATLTHLLRLPEAVPDRTLVHYSRDMHLNDFKSGNVIVIGAQEAVPWVELFESHMDFVFSINNPNTYSSFLNRHPAAGELREYSSETPETRSKVYAVLAFLPNLSGTGNVLIMEGLSMAGTEAAVDLAMDDDRLLPILAKIRKPDGSLPHFELMLESDALGESAGPARVVAMHLHD